MGRSEDGCIRVGVVGLGRLWESRHKPALARLRDRYEVVSVYDQVGRRAEIEARQLGCVAAYGLVELLEMKRVDAVLLLAPQWFGLHALELCVGAGKAIYLAFPWMADLGEVERLAVKVEESGVPFMAEMPRRFYPVTLRLRELLATRLGEPRLIVGQVRLHGFDRYGEPGPSRQLAPGSLLVDPGCNLIDWCRFMVGEEPTEVWGEASELMPTGERDWGPDCQQVFLRFTGGKVAALLMMRHHAQAWGEAGRFLPQPGIQVYAERGAAWLEMPDRIQWSDATGVHEERLPMEPSVGERLAVQFARLVRGEASLAPTMRDVVSVCRLVDRLRGEGRSGNGRV
ncbi:MAG: hypothetical protein KatS3mg108_3027 [Isosphaeraceae bacterium]|nr:MAG: hypothetical protein KatS3mg108_3027 [Isosphaeraceae bacterium]